MKKYLGENALEVLPKLSFNKNFKYAGFTNDEYLGEISGQLTITCDSSDSATDYFEEYVARVVNEGWTKSESEESSASLTVYKFTKLIDGKTNLYHHFELRITGRFIYLWIYPNSTSFSEYFTSRFGENDSVTVKGVVTDTYYNYDASTETKGDVVSSSSSSYNLAITPTAISRTSERSGILLTEKDGNIYYFNYSVSTGTYSTGSLISSGTLKEYNMSASLYPSTFANYESYFNMDASIDGLYTLNEAALSTLISYFENDVLSTSRLNYGLNTPVSLTLAIDFYANTFTVNYSAYAIANNFYIERNVEITYSRPGATTISGLSDLEYPSSN